MLDLSAALSTAINASRVDVYLTGFDSEDSPDDSQSFVFQYFPDEITDSKAINYQTKEIAGGSLPLYQWSGSGERLISFTASFSTDVDFLAHGQQGADTKYLSLKSAGLLRRNVDIRTIVAMLRDFCFPTYGDDTGLGVPATFAPRKMRLFIPNSGIGLWGGSPAGGSVTPDSIICVMTQCDPTVLARFPSGLPRIATVELAFAQIAQYKGAITFPQSMIGAGLDTNLGIRGPGMTTVRYNVAPRKKSH